MNPILYDTTLRDGTQREGLSLSAEDKVRIACRLDALGIGYIEGGWPGSNPKDAEFFRRIADVPLHQAKIAAFGMTRHAGGDCAEDGNCRALVEAGTPVVTLVGKSSTLHVDRVLRTSRDENLRMIAESVSHFKALGKEVIYDAEHFFDGYRLDPAYALATLDAAADAGADCVVLCGTHVAAVAELPESYQHVDPALVGNEMRVVVSELAGRRTVRLRAAALGVPAGEREGAVLQRIKELEHAGYQFEGAEGSFEMLLRRSSADYRAPFEMIEYTVTVENRRGDVRAEASVTLRVAETVMRATAEGAGPVNALDRAVRQTLVPHYPQLAEVRLVDYQVRIVDEHLGTAAKPRVLIESARGDERWSTVGCSENILEASWQALRDALELPLLRRPD